MTAEERTILERLNNAVRSPEVLTQIQPIVERVHADLVSKPDVVMTWSPIPISTYRGALPAQIKSSWIFVLRAGANTGAERHPNSHQRMMSFVGTGDMQIGETKSDTNIRHSRDIEWQSNVLIGDPAASLEQRWIFIPQNVWHQPVVSRETDWVVVSFHTVPAEELIEERPDEESGTGTRQMVYLETIDH
jgi:hypothetical protein